MDYLPKWKATKFVFSVWKGEYEDYSPIGFFSTREGAWEYFRKKRDEYNQDYQEDLERFNKIESPSDYEQHRIRRSEAVRENNIKDLEVRAFQLDNIDFIKEGNNVHPRDRTWDKEKQVWQILFDFEGVCLYFLLAFVMLFMKLSEVQSLGPRETPAN